MLTLMLSHYMRGTVQVHCRLELSYGSKDEAEKVLRAVAADNEGFVAAKTDGSTIISEIKSESILGLLHTVEDYLACVSVAEKTIKAVEKRPHERERQRPSGRQSSHRSS